MIENKAIEPPVLLAPLAGITDLPFRTLVSSFGAGLVVSEMVASQEMVQADPSSGSAAHARAELGLGSKNSSKDIASNTAVQIAGRDAYWMGECAKLCVANGARIIDINMGCPAKKVTNGYSGSALMKDIDHAVRLIDAVVDAVDVPVTLKTRLGWNEQLLNAPELASRAEQAGIQMITIHARTRCQFYKGSADWAAISRVRSAVSIPVIANGDIVDCASARKAIKLSGAHGVMVGRGARGKPWMLAQIAAALKGTPEPEYPIGVEFLDMIGTHYEAMLDFYGEPLGNRVARKHLGWYMDRLPTPPALRKEIITGQNSARVLHLIRKLPTEYCESAS